jgi:transcriptional regulator with XRE-family HTH domain
MLVIVRQIRAARSLLGWEQNDLAVQSGVAISTIRRLEGLKDAPIAANFETIQKIMIAFEQAGIEFLGNPCPGVRLKFFGSQAAREDRAMRS